MVKNEEFSIESNSDKGCPKCHLSIGDSINILNKKDWDSVLQGKDLYLNTDYLHALETTMMKNMEFRYVIFYCSQFTPIGIAYFQMVDLVDTGSKYADAVKKLGKGIGARIVSDLKLRALVNGNVFHCGEHGFLFNDKVSESEALEIVERTIERIKRNGDLSTKASIVLFKEFYPRSFPITENLISKRYHMFRMDMNMELDIDPEWKDMEGYLMTLTSKARTRVKSIMKRSSHLEIRDMDSHEISVALPRMKELFHQVLEKSSFTFGVLEMETYVQWKEKLGDKLLFQGFFENGEMVGFLSAFRENGLLDVHYVGIDYSRNEESAIYQRMLVHLLQEAIEGKAKKLIYGRTAEQAKSSLGARPVEMRLYTKHRNALANKLITPVMSSVVPTSFELRSPFKKA